MPEQTARELLDVARRQLGCGSLYSLARQLGLEPYQVMRYYRNNSMPKTAWLLITQKLGGHGEDRSSV
jgi:hypothetical protein